MALTDEIQRALERLAQDLWDSAPHEAGLALLSEPRDLRSALEDFEDHMRADFDDEFGVPWGLEAETLIHTTWNAAGPGLGSVWSVEVLQLPSHRRLYLERSDWIAGRGIRILSVSEPAATPRTDRKLLQLLFRDNGAALGTGVFGTPPNSVRTSVKSFPFLVDLFVSGFDASADDCWEALLENWEVWNQEYENPPDPIETPSDLLAEADAELLSKHGAPRGMTGGYARRAEVEALARARALQHEIDEFLNEPLRERTPADPQAKAQIVARYLVRALTDPGLG